MTIHRRPLFLAGLLLAAACSDAGTPTAVGDHDSTQPGGAQDNVLAVFTCTVDVRAGTETCGPAQPGTGDAVGTLVQIGNANQVSLTTTNVVSTPTSLSHDRAVSNHVWQPLGTTDGITSHATGVRVWLEPFIIDTAVAGQPTSVTIANADGVLTHKTHKNRPYFQYSGLLQHGATTATRNWQFSMVNVDSFSYLMWVLAEVQYDKGRIWIEPGDTVIAVDSSATLVARVRSALSLLREDITWTSSNPAVVTVAQANTKDTLPVVTGVSEGTAWIRVKSVAAPTIRLDSILVTVNALPAVPLDSMNALANVSVAVSAARVRQGLSAGDSVVPSQFIPSLHGTAIIDANRELTYVADAGFSGQDTVHYDVTDGQWTVQRTLLVNVAPTHYWFVRQGGTGGGSNVNPLGSINAASDSAAAGDTIFVLRNGSNDLVGAHTLDADEALIGEGVSTAFLLEATDLNEASHTDLIFQGQGLGTPLMNTGAPTLTLSSNNVVRGVNISSVNAAAIHGGGFGTLTVGDVIVQADGPALSLFGGDLAGSFLSLSSTNSDSSGITLLNVGGSATVAAGAISGPAGTAVVVNGGTVSLSFSGDVTQGSSSALLAVTGHGTGTLSLGGTLTASNGTGLQFSNADGTYDLGVVVLTNSTGGGADAGVDVTAGSSGTFTFGAGSAITNPAGNVFRIEGSAPAFTYPGTFSKSGAGVGVLIQNNTGGSVTFSGSSKSLSTGASHGVAILADEANVTFSGGGLVITTAGGRGFYAQDADTLAVTGAGNLVASTGAAAVYIANARSGAGGVSFQSVSGSGGANAVVINTFSEGGFQVTGTGTAGSGGTLSATGTAVLLANTDSTRLRRVAVTAPVAFSASSFGALRLDSASVTSTAGKALGLATGRLYVSNVAVAATGGAALDSHTGTLNGSFSSLSATTATGNAVLLTSSLGSVTALAGTVVVNAGGGAAIAVTGPTAVGLTYRGNVTQNANAALLDVSNGHTGTLAFNTGTLAAPNGTGLQFDNADGTYTFSGTITLSNSVGGADAGIDVINGSGGSFSFPRATTITNPAGEAIRVAGSAPTFSYVGSITKTNGGTGITVTGSTGAIAISSITGSLRTITSSGSNPAVNLANNTGAVINFGGGNLAIASDDGNAFNVTGGGTVTVTGLTNTLSSTGGIALNVNATSTGASGMTFRSISADGGTHGIALNSMGTGGGVQVVGNGGVCTLATPACSGGILQNTTGDAVSLNGVNRVRLALVRVLNSGGHGIAGTATSGLTLAHSVVQGAGDADDEAGLFFAAPGTANLTGRDSILSSVVHAPSDGGVVIHNQGGTLGLVVQGSTFSGTDIGTPGVVTGDDLFRLVADAGSTITAQFTGNTFDQSENDGLAALAQSGTGSGGGTLNVTVDGNTFDGDNGGASCASGCNDNAIVVAGANGATVRFTIQDNDVQDHRNEAIVVRADDDADVQGTLQDNTVGGVALRSGSYLAQGISVTNDDNSVLVARLAGNAVGSTFSGGIVATADGSAGAPAMDLTLTGNTVASPDDNSGPYWSTIGLLVSDAATACANVSGNTAAAGMGGGGSIDIAQSGIGSDVRLQGLPAPTNDASAYVAGENPAASSPVYAFTTVGDFTDATCATPAATPSL
jgi:hypothetical protein